MSFTNEEKLKNKAGRNKFYKYIIPAMSACIFYQLRYEQGLTH